MKRTFNGHPITKLETPSQGFSGSLTYGDVLSIEKVKNLIESLECGYYDIKGSTFQIMEKWNGEKDIVFSYDDRADNYISKYIDFKMNNRYENELAMGLRVEHEDDYEPSCMSCGDGGCINCMPHWFI